MKKKISILLICLLIIGFIPMNSAYGYYNDREYLDIKIGKNFSSFDYINLSSENGFYIYDKHNKNGDIKQIIESNIMVTSNGYGELEVLNLQNDVLETIPGDGSQIIGSGSMYDSIITIGPNEYRGYITFVSNSNEITLINHVEIEDYLYGVVPKEMGHGFNMESLKAQAVAARTFAVASKNKHKDQGFNLCDTTHCQVYAGKIAEHPNTNRAVDDTRGLYLYYKGQLAETMYHSNNGGYMESSKNAWGGQRDYLEVREDPFSKDTNASTWELEFTNKELSEKIVSSGIDIGEILDIEILETSSGNRVKKINLIGTSGEEVITGSRLGGILDMRSTWFDITKDGQTKGSSSKDVYVYDSKTSQTVMLNLDNVTIINGDNEIVKLQNKTSGTSSNKSGVEGFVFNGRGYGHGVGMSQFGALEMAKQGYSYEEILNHYYVGVDLKYKGQ